MDTPQPIDTNRLKAMLGGAKKIMNKVETGDYNTGNVNGESLSMGDQLVENVPAGNQPTGNYQPKSVAPKTKNGKANYPNYEKSKMPEYIKKAMMEQPIPQINGMPQSFTLDEVMDYDQDEKEVPPPVSKSNRKQNINENYKSQLNDKQIRQIIREEMSSIVKEEMIEFFTKYFAKSLAEDTQKKLIQHLIKEGKISVNKKKKTRK